MNGRCPTCGHARSPKDVVCIACDKEPEAYRIVAGDTVCLDCVADYEERLAARSAPNKEKIALAQA